MEKSNKSTTQRPQGNRIMDAQLVTIDLPFFIKQLKSEKLWKKSDRNSITIFKSTGISIVLIALHKGAEMAKHTTEGLISVQMMKGEIKFRTNDQSVKLRKGNILTLYGGVPHSLQAKRTTIILLTVTDAIGNNHISDEIPEQNKVNGKLLIRETA